MFNKTLLNPFLHEKKKELQIGNPFFVNYYFLTTRYAIGKFSKTFKNQFFKISILILISIDFYKAKSRSSNLL